MKKSAEVIATTEVKVAAVKKGKVSNSLSDLAVLIEEKSEDTMVGKRVLANNGSAVVITGDGKCKKVYPDVEDIDVNELNKSSLVNNNKILFEAIKGQEETVTLKKGWIGVKGFKLRFAPAGFEMYDMENRKTPIDLGETPTIDEVLKFLAKPTVKKLTENRKKVEPTTKQVVAKAVAEGKTEEAPVVEMTDEDRRASGLKLLQTYARKDFRFLDEMIAALRGVMTNRKYSVQLNKTVKEFTAFRPVTQKKNYPQFIKDLRAHLKEFDFTPAPVRAPKFTGLSELDYAGGITFIDPQSNVSYVTASGTRIGVPYNVFLAHDILYNWSDYYVAIMYVARGQKTAAEMVEEGLVVKDIFCEFDKALLETPNEEVTKLLRAIYDWQEEVTPFEFVFKPEGMKVGDKISVRWDDLKKSFSGIVKNVSPVEIAYEFGDLSHLLKHQSYKIG